VSHQCWLCLKFWLSSLNMFISPQDPSWEQEPSSFLCAVSAIGQKR
jgi:hypothetical protein